MLKLFVDDAIDTACAVSYTASLNPIDVNAFNSTEPIAQAEPYQPSHAADRSSRRPLRILIVGEEQDIVATIGLLQQRGFAQQTDWSRPVPCRQAIDRITKLLANLSEHSMISLMTRYFVR